VQAGGLIYLTPGRLYETNLVAFNRVLYNFKKIKS